MLTCRLQYKYMLARKDGCITIVCAMSNSAGHTKYLGSREIWPKIGWKQGALPQNKQGAGSIRLGAGSIGTKKWEHLEYLRWEQGDLGPK